jgi:hypothetical protein
LLQERTAFSYHGDDFKFLNALLDGVLTPKPHRTLLAAETVLLSTDRFDHGDSLRNEYVTHWILDHLILFFVLDL